MAAPMWDFVALRPIFAPSGARAYNAGDGLMAEAVDTLGLVIGQDVHPARAGVVPKPAGNAKRSDWAVYALAEGKDTDWVDDRTRDELAAAFTDPPAAGPDPEPAGGKKSPPKT